MNIETLQSGLLVVREPEVKLPTRPGRIVFDESGEYYASRQPLEWGVQMKDAEGWERLLATLYGDPQVRVGAWEPSRYRIVALNYYGSGMTRAEVEARIERMAATLPDAAFSRWEHT